MDIGIDLGTTFSAIAVKGEVQLTPGYPAGIYLSECDVTVIPTPEGDLTFPSVLWVDPEDPEHILVGADARQKARDGDCPVMWSKRSIGTDQELPAGNSVLTATEVATHILRYLKSCAERALGQPVARAVVTHPAYFDPNQVEETRNAAAQAGFDMSRPEQMMMEPVAAALAFLHNDERDPLRVMTYDLGGGTFDVTVLEKSQGDISMKAFDGDHLLGGYNFDRELVSWILDRLHKANPERVIPYDENNPEDRGRRARLLQLAENVKVDLSEQRNSKVQVNVRAPDILLDIEGRAVPIAERISREEYAELMRPFLEKTIICCNAALGKAQLPGPPDCILLVGGSTCGRWVSDAVSQAFDVEVEPPYNPDSCVAAGAAIQASMLPPPTGIGAGIRVDLDLQHQYVLPTINVSGTVKDKDGGLLPEELRSSLQALLTTPQGDTRDACPLSVKGGFLFEDVELLEDGTSRLTIKVVDGEGLERFSATHTAEYTPEGGETSITTVLPKPLYLKVGDGLVPLAEEGVPLPARCEVTLEKAWDGVDRVEVPVVLDGREIGVVLVTGIPEDAGKGSPVEICVDVTKENEVRGTCKVLTRAGVVAQQGSVRISFPPISLPGLSDMRGQYEDLRSQREQLELLSDDPEQRTVLRLKGRKIVKELDRLFGELEPDRQEIDRALRQLDRLVNPPPDDMDPPRSEVNRRLSDCEEMLGALSGDPQTHALRQVLEKIRADTADAINTKNHKKWKMADEHLAKLQNRMTTVAEGGAAESSSGSQLPPPALLKDQAHAQMDGMRSALRIARSEVQRQPDYETVWKNVADQIDRALDRLDMEIDKISDDGDPNQALYQIRIVLRPADGLMKDIKRIGKTVVQRDTPG